VEACDLFTLSLFYWLVLSSSSLSLPLVVSVLPSVISVASVDESARASSRSALLSETSDAWLLSLLPITSSLPLFSLPLSLLSVQLPLVALPVPVLLGTVLTAPVLMDPLRLLEFELSTDRTRVRAHLARPASARQGRCDLRLSRLT
jgi:hypothetical protein